MAGSAGSGVRRILDPGTAEVMILSSSAPSDVLMRVGGGMMGPKARIRQCFVEGYDCAASEAFSSLPRACAWACLVYVAANGTW